jgi:phosphohistidine phosphatase
MKRIYLMRHGKAEEGHNKSDFDRDLMAKGIKKTLKVARFLEAKKVRPQQLLVSMANRTLQTATIIKDTLSLSNSAIIEEKSLYLASSHSILDEIYALDDHISEVMIIGHNPGISSLATYLCKKEIDWMPTSAIAGIEMKLQKWNELPNISGKLLFYVKPADL